MCILWYLLSRVLFFLNIIVVLWYRLVVWCLNSELISIMLCFLVNVFRCLVFGFGMGLVRLNLFIDLCW